MKRARIASFFALALALIMMAVNWLAVPLPDWAVRTAGVAMLLAIAVMAYSIVKGSAEK